MANEPNICPTCKRPFKKGLLIPVVIGGAVGLIIGEGFVAYWFGTAPGFFHPMALIHGVSGTILGMLGGLIVGALRK